jgi:hypothetical protein
MGICTAFHDMIVVEEYGEEFERCAQCGHIEAEEEVDPDDMRDAWIDIMAGV